MDGVQDAGHLIWAEIRTSLLDPHTLLAVVARSNGGKSALPQPLRYARNGCAGICALEENRVAVIYHGKDIVDPVTE